MIDRLAIITTTDATERLRRKVNELVDGVNVGGSGGAASWGGITGTLSAQTDLQSALNAKASVASVADKQSTLVSGSNIKTINGTSILGSGNISVSGGGGSSNSYFPSGW